MANGSGSSNGTLILVLGILGIICCNILGPVAWIMGNNALAQLNQGYGNEADRGMINAGRICGIIGTVILVLGVVFGVVFGVLGAFLHPAVRTYS